MPLSPTSRYAGSVGGVTEHTSLFEKSTGNTPQCRDFTFPCSERGMGELPTVTRIDVNSLLYVVNVKN